MAAIVQLWTALKTFRFEAGKPADPHAGPSHAENFGTS
jgi:hypothetical protein